MTINKRNNYSEQSVVLHTKLLFKIGGIFSLLTILAIILSIISFIIWPLFPKEILQLINTNHLAGLLSLDILYLIAVLFTLPLIIAIFIMLRNIDYSLSLMALIFGIMGIILLIPARPITEMIVLSNLYDAVSTNTEKMVIQTISEVTLQQFNGTSYKFHLLFGDISFILFSFLMLKSKNFSKPIGILGIVTNTFALGMFIPVIGPFIGLVFLLGFMPWLFFISLTLFRY